MTKRKVVVPVTEDEVFEYLDDLRESGVTNMYGAPAYVMREFGVDQDKAIAFTSEWMRTFRQRHPR